MLLETQAKLLKMGVELAGLREKVAGDAAAPADASPIMPPTAREAQLRRSLQQAEQRITELEQQLAEIPRNQDTRAELEALRARTAEAVRLLADAHGMRLTATEAPPSVGFLQRYRSWIVGVVALVLGFAAGIAVIDYRIRKRYGGFRI